MPAYQAVPRFPESTVERMRHAAQQVTAWASICAQNSMKPRKLEQSYLNFCKLCTKEFSI